MIVLKNRCAEVISHFASDIGIKIALPSDICKSVTNAFDLNNIQYSFYPIQRNYISKDEYDFSKFSNDDLFLVSDLYNFQAINIDSLIKKKIFLDLAHCSLMTANYYINKLLNTDIKGIFISFGKGKFYRFGGGGMGFNPIDIHNLFLPKTPIYHIKDLTKKILDMGIYNETSTRVIVSEKDFDLDEIKALRENGMDISDGEYDHIKKKNNSHYIVWKNISNQKKKI